MLLGADTMLGFDLLRAIFLSISELMSISMLTFYMGLLLRFCLYLAGMIVIHHITYHQPPAARLLSAFAMKVLAISPNHT